MKSKLVLFFMMFFLLAGLSNDYFAEETKEMRDILFNCRHGSCPSDFFRFNDIALFIAEDAETGRELWRTDGTKAGTVLIKDINPGRWNSKIIPMGVMDEIFYFSAENGGKNGKSGKNLWRSDGTETGTFMVKDLEHDIEMKHEDSAVMGDDLFYFFANDGFSSLWVSDGTESGTIMLEGPKFWYRGNLNLLDDVVYFRGNSKLWKYAKAENRLIVVADPDTKETFSKVNDLVKTGDFLYFTGRNKDGMPSLYRSNGTYRGSTIIKTIGVSKKDYTYKMQVINGVIYFEAKVENNHQIWRSDGTEDGTIMLKEELHIHSDLTFNNGNVYFAGSSGLNDLALWKSDGTPDGTVMVKKVNAYEFIQFNNLIYFAQFNQDSIELWKSDGTEKGTSPVISIDKLREIQRLFRFKNKLIFSGKDLNRGEELWQTDGTANGTRLLKDIKPDSIGSEPEIIYHSDKVVYFSTPDASHGRELWVSDGTIKGTYMVKDINPGPQNGIHQYFQGALFEKGILYFEADDGVHGQELWRSDGTHEGTYMVIDLYKGPRSFLSTPPIPETDNRKKTIKSEKSEKRYTPIPERFSSSFPFFFAGNDGIHGYELWISDGTTKGTRMVKDINKGPEGSVYGCLFYHNDLFYFSVYSSTKGMNIWVSDGTDKGTQRISDFSPLIPKNSLPYDTMEMAGNDLYVTSDSIDSQNERVIKLWRIDTHHKETFFIKDLCRGSSCYYDTINSFLGVDSTLYYQWSYDEGGFELWRSDGTKKGTFILAKDPLDIEQGFDSLADKNGQMWGIKPTNDASLELWKSDGTVKGTVLFKKLSAPKDQYYDKPSRFFELNGKTHFFFYQFKYENNIRTLDWKLWQSDGSSKGTNQCANFTVKNGKTNYLGHLVSGNTIYIWVQKENLKQQELWQSDGTQNGTRMIARLNTFSSFNYPQDFTSINGNSFFILNDGYHGQELWRSDGTQKGTYRVTGEDLHPIK